MRILQVQWIALSVLCSLLLSFWVSFVKFYNSVNSSVQYLTECRLVHNLVFSPLSVLAYKECPQYVGEVKPPSLQWYRTFEIGIAVYLFGYPILFLSVQHLAIVHFHTKSIKDSLISFKYARQSSKHKAIIIRSVHAPIISNIILISTYTIN